jgi:acetoacetyl-CoA synthetase
VSAGGEPIWAPAPDDVTAAQVSRFARWLTQDGRARLTGGYLELWRWSTEQLEEFWPAVWDYFGVRSATPYQRVLSGSVMPDVQWFTGAQVSYVEHLFRGRDPERVALIDAKESARPGGAPVSRQLTWGMLPEQVGDLAAMLRDLGVRPGDRVAGYVPNAAEAVIAFLATASVGAIWSGCGQDYSPAAAAERLSQLEPVVLIAADGYRYGGREFDRRGSVSELAALLPTLRATIVFARRVGSSADIYHVVERLDEIIAVPAIPHTRTGKKLEIPVKRILQGGDPRQVVEAGAVDNPDALRWFAAHQTRTPIR